MVREQPPDLAFDAPDWWLEIARNVLREMKHTKLTQDQLVVELAKLVDRTWDRSKISNFIHGSKPTQAFVEALCQYFPEIPRPFFVPRHAIEARALQQVVDLVTALSNPSPHVEKQLRSPVAVRSGAKPQKLAALDEDATQLEREASHTGSLESKDEDRAQSRRRPRRVP